MRAPLLTTRADALSPPPPPHVQGRNSSSFPSPLSSSRKSLRFCAAGQTWGERKKHSPLFPPPSIEQSFLLRVRPSNVYWIPLEREGSRTLGVLLTDGVGGGGKRNLAGGGRGGRGVELDLRRPWNPPTSRGKLPLQSCGPGGSWRMSES